MKTQFLSILSLFLLLASTISAQNYTVLDSQGNIVQAGSLYYVVPFVWADASGVTLTNYLKPLCPYTLGQGRLDISLPNNYGVACSFHPAVASTDGAIHLSKSLNVKFTTPSADIPRCVNSTVWRVGNFDAKAGAPLITTGGVQGNPSCSTKTNWFKIEKSSTPSSYKFTYKPDDVCVDEIGQPAYDLSMRSLSTGPRIFVRSSASDPFEVAFIKYGTQTNAAAIGSKAAA